MSDRETAASPDEINAKIERQKRVIFIGCGGVAVAGLIAFALFGGGSTGVSKSKGDRASISVDAMVASGTSEQAWVTTSEARMAELEKAIKALPGIQTEVAELSSRNTDLEKENKQITDDAIRVATEYESELDRLRGELHQLKNSRRGSAQRSSTAAADAAQQPVSGTSGQRFKPAQRGPKGTARSINYGDDFSMSSPEVAILTFAGGDDVSGYTVSAAASELSISDDPDYLPPNSYASARVLVGVDATAGTRSQTDPLPVVLRITGPARSVVDNGKLLETRIDGCIINGAARAELSAEKVYIKLLRMTCDETGGGVAVSDIKGFVSYGGKTGVRGKVVSREGSLVAQAAFAGIAGGFGRGFSANSNALFQGATIATNGDRPQLSTGEIAEAGLGQGLATAGDMVSQYLIERAEQYQPVVEMPTGLDVTVHFLDGVQVRTKS